MKRMVCSMLLLAALALQMILPAGAAGGTTVAVGSAEELAELAGACVSDAWSRGKRVVLTADLDLTGTAFTPIPLFGGEFDGQGHTVRGISLTGSGSAQGLFRRILPGGTVCNLHVEGRILPQGSRSAVGGIAGSNGGTIRDCSFSGMVAGMECVGGIAGVNEAEGMIIGCSADGSVAGEHRAGGIAGENYGAILTCSSGCSVNTVSIEPEAVLPDLEHVLSSLTVSQEELIDITDIGGVAGWSSGILQGCVNTGPVGYARVGYNVGGIVGRQSGYTSGCENRGTVLGRKDVGGIAGQMEPYAAWQFSDASLESLQEELGALQERLRQALESAGRKSDALRGGLERALDQAGAAGEALNDLAAHTEGWANANLEELNLLSVRLSELLDGLTPVGDQAAAFLEDMEQAAAQWADALEALADAGEDVGLTEQELRSCLAALRTALSDAADGAARIRQGMEYLRSALGDEAAALQALQEVSDGFAALRSAADHLEAALPGAGAGGLEVFLEALRAELPQAAEGLAQISGALAQLAAGFRPEELADAQRSLEAGLSDLAGALDGLSQAAGALHDAGPDLYDAGEDLTSAAALAAGAAGHLEAALDGLGEAVSDLTDVLAAQAERAPLQFTVISDSAEEARGRLLDALGGASDAVDAMTADLSAQGGRLQTDLQAVSDQLFRVFDRLLETLESSGSRTGDYTEDVSASQMQEPGNGVVRGCLNRGTVSADTNAGGIVGAISLDVSFDPEDALNLSGMLSAESRYLIYAAVRGCESRADVTAKKSAAGGIVGRMDYGLAEDSAAFGQIACTEGDYAGGIAGYCLGTVRRSWAQAVLSGHAYIGGIAGLGGDLSDCRALAEVADGTEYVGAVAGASDGVLSGNYYSSESVPGGVDGFTYAGQTEAVDRERLLQAGTAPEGFGTVSVTFAADGIPVKQENIPFGGGIPEFPAVPDREGQYWSWDEKPGRRVYADLTVEGEYCAPVTVLATEGAYPLFLAEGTFREGQALTAEAWSPDHSGLDPQEDQALTAYVLRVEGAPGALKIRMRCEGGGTLYLLQDGMLQETAYETDGSYLVFRMENGGAMAYAAPRTHASLWWVLAPAAAAAGGAVLLLRRAAARKKQSGAGAPAA